MTIVRRTDLFLAALLALRGFLHLPYGLPDWLLPHTVWSDR